MYSDEGNTAVEAILKRAAANLWTESKIKKELNNLSKVECFKEAADNEVFTTFINMYNMMLDLQVRKIMGIDPDGKKGIRKMEHIELFNKIIDGEL